MEEGFTYEQNPADALRIMLRMAGFTEDEIDEEAIAEARRIYESPVTEDEAGEGISITVHLTPAQSQQTLRVLGFAPPVAEDSDWPEYIPG